MGWGRAAKARVSNARPSAPNASFERTPLATLPASAPSGCRTTRKRWTLPVMTSVTRIFAFFIFAFLTTGCTTITITGTGSELTCAGFSEQIAETKEADLIAVKSNGLGMFKRESEFTLGWLSEIRVYGTNHVDKCRVILIPEHPENISNLLAVLASTGTNLSEVCVIKERGSK